ncbi:SIMPL domain-containing protein [Pontibacter anaerobius]|uniref:SIMPL domain-containing protein n=1 Tax=Pontibacter anaerobius TaxID=2993940 RepID=A0ABT3RH90_9BACT|nr:SIMPL domain-containing protein [Pontibacter anaerobius]MCX2740866.1 SIMPL domain-containing protein [Pontibacter anaerobius]
MKKMSLMLLLCLFFVAALPVQAQQGQVLPPLVSVNGTGEVRVQPNEVVVNLGVETRGKSLDEARKETDKKAAAIISYLKKQGVDAKHIQTSYVTLRPVYSSGEYGRTSPDFYLAQKSMTVIIKKLNKFDELLSGLYEVGANHVDGVQFQVSNSEIEKYKAEARKKAVANAKEKATQLTSELGAKLGRVYAISESGSNGGPRPMYKMAVMESAGYDSAGGPTIAGGEVVITSNVDVSFVIE